MRLVNAPHRTPVIIAGVNKAGTTSLFRYLCDHPSVCGSVIKEANFFLRTADRKPEDPWSEYLGIFPRVSETHRICVEASPIYLSRSDEVAKRIAEWFPESRIIFVLREPVGRFLSFLRSYQNRDADIVSTASEREILSAVLACRAGFVQPQNNMLLTLIARELQRGRYSDYLPVFYGVFPAAQILVLFYDDLERSPRGFMKRVAEFVGIDPAFYDRYCFQVENKTRIYRSVKVQRIVHKMNMVLEPFFNRHRRLHRSLRTIYTTINEMRSKEREVNTELNDILVWLYSETVEDLRDLLVTKNPNIVLPQWLRV